MKRLHRSNDQMVAGVCGGIAETYNMDPTLVRVGVAIGGICTGFFPLGFIYLVAWAIFPKKAY